MTDETDAPNEILAAAKAHARAAERAAAATKVKHWPVGAIGFGFGAAIGSAAVAAAVLYARRRGERDGG